MFRITIAVDDFTEEQIKHLKNELISSALIQRVSEGADETIYRNALDSSAIFVGWPDPSWLLNSSLRLLQLGSSGWEAYQHKGLENGRIKICTARGVHSIGVAEHCIAMMMALVRKLPLHFVDKGKKLFQRHAPYGEVSGTTACIVGMGDIGSALAKRCKGLDMRVWAVVKDITEKYCPYTDRLFSVEQMAEAFSGADHIFLTLSAGRENYHLINESNMQSIAPHTFFYNVSRGALVDEAFLCRFIQESRIAGAGIDVTEREPPDQNSPLWQLGDQVMITGHSAGISKNFPVRFYHLVVRNCKNFIENRPLENQVL